MQLTLDSLRIQQSATIAADAVLSETERFILELLRAATSEKPLRNEDIREAFLRQFHRGIGEREVKNIIQTLRQEHAYPILASRRRPAGYWFCKSAEEMKEWMEVFRSQALDELRTARRILKQHYPELAGQLAFGIEE